MNELFEPGTRDFEAEIRSALHEIQSSPPFVGDAREAPVYRRFLSALEQVPEGLVRVGIEHLLGGLLLHSRFGETPSAREIAIETLERVLQVVTRESQPDLWLSALTWLVRAYRWRQSGDPADNLERAIAAALRALKFCTRRSNLEGWFVLLSSLGDCYLLRILGDQAQNLEASLCIHHRALEVVNREEAPELWANSMDSMGLAFTRRLRGDRLENLERAIEYGKEAVAVLSPGSEQWATTVTNLGSAYANRIAGGPLKNLDLALSLYQQVIPVWERLARPKELAKVVVNLGTTLRRRTAGVPSEQLRRAIALYDQALAVIDRRSQPFDWATIEMNRADAYRLLAIAEPAVGFKLAIASSEEVRRVLARDLVPVEWARATHNLALVLQNQVAAGSGSAADLRRAVHLFEETLAVFTREETPLEWANALLGMATALATPIFGTPLDATRARALFHQALEVLPPQLVPDRCRKAAYNLGLLELGSERWNEASQAFGLCLQATALLDEGSILRGSREAALSELDDLFREAAYCLARTGDLVEAVVVLESGRARRLAGALIDQGELDRLAGVDAGLDRRYRQAAASIQEVERNELAMGTDGTAGARGLDALYERSLAARGELASVLDEIRRLPGFAEFRRAADFPRIAEAVLPERPLLYLSVSLQGSLALLLHRPTGAGHEGHSAVRVEVFWLENFRVQDLKWLLGHMRSETLALSRNLEPGKSPAVRSFSFLELLGDSLLAPLVPRLRTLAAPGLALVPCGPASILPLHAASFSCAGGRACLIDEYNVSYAPSAVALSAADGASVQARAYPPFLAGVGDPQPDTAPLPFARAELEQIAEIFDPERREILIGDSATKDALLAVVAGASHLHLACHGAFDALEPLDSALFLAGEALTLREILALDTFRGCRLAVLSACQTALTDVRRSTDEAIGLPAGFLMAGVRGVVGTLWSVNDVSTALAMTRFYELQLGGGHVGEALPPAAALCRAQRWLRDLTQGDLQRYLLSHPSLDLRGGFEPLDPEDRPFSDPYYWAAFVFVGA